MDATRFNASVYNALFMIPAQQVTSCKHIARLIGAPTQARRVSEVVRLIAHTSPSAPWHRVISTSGILAAHGNLGDMQRTALEQEGVSVSRGLIGEMRIDFDKWGWFENVKLLAAEYDSTEWGS